MLTSSRSFCRVKRSFQSAFRCGVMPWPRGASLLGVPDIGQERYHSEHCSKASSSNIVSRSLLFINARLFVAVLLQVPDPLSHFCDSTPHHPRRCVPSNKPTVTP